MSEWEEDGFGYEVVAVRRPTDPNWPLRIVDES